MHNGTVIGLVATLASGLLQGTMLTPMKYLRKWRWENIWLVFATFGYFLLPWAFAAATVPHLLSVYASSPHSALLHTGLFGMGWGCAAVLFGLGIDLVGLALGYAIILGLGTSVGSLVPLLTLHPEKLWTRAGEGTILGVLMLISSVILFSLAGKKRERMLRLAAKNSSLQGGESQRRFLKGLIFCILCGVLNPLLNFALAYGAGIQSQATKYGASPAAAPNAIWVVVANAGFVPNAIYCFYLLSAKSSWRFFPAASVSYWAVTPLMGLMWISGTVLYGAGASLFGPLGPVIGWPLVMSAIILTATFWGFVSGEWKGVHGAPVRLMAVGLSILLGAIVVLALSARFE